MIFGLLLRAPILAFLGWITPAPPPTAGAIAVEVADAIDDDSVKPGDAGVTTTDDADSLDADSSEGTDLDRPANTGPVAVKMWSENHREGATVKIGRDGSTDAKSAKMIKRLFRCKRTNRQRRPDKGVLKFIAEVSARWPGATIEIVSAYRGMKREKRTSNHLKGRAVDFRIKGVKIAAVRDYMWKHFRDVGVGYYPESGFVHVDHRTDPDIAWTERNGKMRFHPGWAEKIRSARDELKAEYKAKVEKLKAKKAERKRRAGS